jgi:DNA-binding CsgD family transcriptional regulator
VTDDETTAYPVEPRRRAENAVPYLTAIAGASAGQRTAVRESEVVIGRDPQAGIRLTDSGVSRQHAKLVIASDGIVNLIDLGSRNGTFVNGARTDLAVLREGDRIQVGPEAVLRLSYEVEVEPQKRRTRRGTALTKRELEVARLVARGLTNAEIADRLSIKLRTVTTHLDHIYTRLDIRTRTALARHVIEAGLSKPDDAG